MEDKEKIDKKELVKKQLQVLSDIEESVKMESVVKNNQIKFVSGKDTYRVRKPNFAERNELHKIRREHYLNLVKDPKMLFQKQWRALYKEKGIDIEKMDSDIGRCQNEIEALLLRLVKIQDEKSIKTIRDSITELRNKQYNISMEKTELLSYSVEDQLLLHVNTYTAFLVLERKEEDKWVRSFETFEDFNKCSDEDLMPKVFKYISLLIYGDDYNESQNT